MSYTTTFTATYTATDVNKVIDCFAADFDMIAQSTGLRTRENVKLITADVRRMAVAGYLEEANLYLVDAASTTIRAAKYSVSESASLWSSDKPGKSLWPSCPNGALRVHVTHNGRWRALTQAQRDAFEASYNVPWATANLDTSFPMLSASDSQRYASNAFGLRKTIYT